MVLTDSKYAQKSKLFLLPLTGLKKDTHIKPVCTYVIDTERGITELDYKLIVPFTKDESSEFSYYEDSYILKSKNLDITNYFETDKLCIYVFDLYEYKEDYDRFLEGKYTEFSTRTKSLINIYWGKVQGKKFYPHPKIEAYMSPMLETYERVARELASGPDYIELLDSLIKNKEILDKPDLVKETFTFVNDGLTEIEN